MTLSDYRTIPLTQGQVALVDASDHEWLSQHKWCAHWDPTSKCFRAMRGKRVNGKNLTIWMHREILGLHRGDPRIGDHINTDRTLDNRRGNLRIADDYQSTQNRRVYASSTTGIKGVYSDGRGNWRVNIQANRKRVYVGRFKTLEEARSAYRSAADRLHGEFSNHGDRLPSESRTSAVPLPACPLEGGLSCSESQIPVALNLFGEPY